MKKRKFETMLVIIIVLGVVAIQQPSLSRIAGGAMIIVSLAGITFARRLL